MVGACLYYCSYTELSVGSDSIHCAYSLCSWRGESSEEDKGPDKKEELEQREDSQGGVEFFIVTYFRSLDRNPPLDLDIPEELVRREERNQSLEEEGFVEASRVQSVYFGEVAFEDGPAHEHLITHVQKEYRQNVRN